MTPRPFDLDISCEGQKHIVRLIQGRAVLLHHDHDSERTMLTFGAIPPSLRRNGGSMGGLCADPRGHSASIGTP